MADLLSMRQVTQQLGISERTVYRLMEEGELTPFKMGKSWRFEQSDIDAYIGRLRQESAAKRGRLRGATEDEDKEKSVA
jgi:excisionase family DNA binding protein